MNARDVLRTAVRAPSPGMQAPSRAEARGVREAEAAALPRVAWVREDAVLPGGLRIAVFRAGRTEGTAPTLLLVHGLGHWSQAAWGRIAPYLADAYHLVAFDLPGFGASDRPDAPYDPSFFTMVLGTLVEQLGLRRFALVGHSLGGLVAASYAARAADRVALLALLDPAGFSRPPRLFLFAAASRPATWLLRRGTPAGLVRRTLQRATLDPHTIAEDELAEALRLARDPDYVRAFVRVYAGGVRDAVALRALHRRLAAYAGPVLLLWGRHDRYVPVAALARARRIFPQAEVHVFEHSAHLPQVEEPEAVAARLRAAYPGVDADA